MGQILMLMPGNGNNQQSGRTEHQSSTTDRNVRNANINNIFRAYVNGISDPAIEKRWEEHREMAEEQLNHRGPNSTSR